MSQAILDLGVLQERKLTGGFYNRGLVRLHLIRVVVLYRAYPWILMEVIQQFGSNITSFQLAMG